MISDLYEELEQVVPNVPEMLLESCCSLSAKAREITIQKQRVATIIPIIREETYPTNFLPPRDNFFYIAHCPPDEILMNVTPQQIQFISLLADYVMKNPGMVIKALESQHDQGSSNKYFIFMCYSVIPSFFGYFSSNEHINNAFSFYCTLVGLSNEKIVDSALIPFYSNGCTYRFVEMIYSQFGLKFCHDFRLDCQQIRYDLISEYKQPLIDAIMRAFPLLPQTHKFLLKFMIRRGRSSKSVLHFFLHRFALPQLLRYLKGTPFTSHFGQLKALAITLRDNSNNSPCNQILKVFDSQSLFEVPSAFTVFDTPYTQLLLTSLDVHVMMTVLQQVTQLPQHLKAFREQTYFSTVNLIPFWVRLYNRNPKPQDTTMNWRPVVFAARLVANKEVCKAAEKPDFERMYRKLVANCVEHRVKPVQFLKGQYKSVILFHILNAIKQHLGEKFDKFLSYTIERETSDLYQRANIFEQYLVHSMSKQALEQWKLIVEANYTMIVLPIAQQRMTSLLKKKMNPTAESIGSVINTAMQGSTSPIVKQLLYMMVIQHLLHSIIPAGLIKKMDALDSIWEQHIMFHRENVALPKIFKNETCSDRAVNATILLNKKIWEAIEHLKVLKTTKFEWSLKIIMDTLYQLDELISIDNGESAVVQFVVAYSDCSVLISRFLIINIFVVKQKVFHTMTNENRDMVLWSCLESTILKLTATNEKLMNYFLSLQDELMYYQIE